MTSINIDIPTLVSFAFLALGLSFAYKCLEAIFFGKLSYWSGFLPISIISPLFIHLPANQDPMIKTTRQWWIHLTAGPLFFVISLCFLVVGADRLGWHGTDYVNSFLTMGNSGELAIGYNKNSGYSFPILVRAGNALAKIISAPVPQDQQAQN